MRHVGWIAHRAALAALIVLGAASAARAAAKVECHAGGGYVVIGRERTDEAGTDFLVRRVQPGVTPPCVYKQEGGDLVLADKSKPYWFKDMRGDYLILTASTGPTETLLVFDLSTRRKVLDLTAADLKIDERGISFWARTEEGTPTTCKTFAKIKKDGFQPMIETKARFIFAEAKMIEIKARRCVAAQ